MSEESWLKIVYDVKVVAIVALSLMTVCWFAWLIYKSENGK